MPISSIHNTSYYVPKYAHRAKEERIVAEEPKTEETVPKEEPSKVKEEKSIGGNAAFSSTGNDKGGFNTSSWKPGDSSSNLTRRLVAASVQFEVQQVVAAASKELVNLRITAAVSKGEDATVARSYIKKLEKLLNRADKKIKALNNEDMIKIQQGRAEQLKQKKRAEEIKVELRKKLNERRMKENGYLLEEIQEKLLGGITGNSSIKSDAAAESEITAQAEAIAAAEAGIVAGVGSGDTESGAGEAASVTVDSASGGGGDISVETINVSEE